MLRAAVDSLSARPVTVAAAAAARATHSCSHNARACSTDASSSSSQLSSHPSSPCARSRHIECTRLTRICPPQIAQRSFASSASQPQDLSSASVRHDADLLDLEDGPLLDPNHLQQIIESSTRLNTAQELKDHIVSVTALLGHLAPSATRIIAPPPELNDTASSTQRKMKARAFDSDGRRHGSEDMGLREQQRESVALVLFQTALQALERWANLPDKNIIGTSTAAALMTTATQAIRSHDELYEAILDFIRIMLPQIQALSSTQSRIRGESHPERVLAKRILPAIIVAFGTAGYPHLGERLIYDSTATMPESQSLKTCMQLISEARHEDGKRVVAGQDEGTPNPDPRSAALAALRSAEATRTEHAAVSASKPWTSKKHAKADVKKNHESVFASPAASSVIRALPLPDIVKFRLGFWSGKTNVWTSLIQSRLAANDELGAEVWLHIYRACMHHRRALSIKEEKESLTHEELHLKWMLPPPSSTPYQARIQSRVPGEYRVFRSRKKQRAHLWSRTQNRAKLSASSDVAAPIVSPDQTWLTQRILGFMNRDKVDADAVLTNALIGFEVSCARFKNAVDLIEWHIRNSVRAVIHKAEEAERTSGASRKLLTVQTALDRLGPGLLYAMSEMYTRRSKMLASQPSSGPVDLFGEDEGQTEERAEYIRAQKEALMLPLINSNTYPFTEYLCGTTVGDILPLYLQIHGQDDSHPRAADEDKLDSEEDGGYQDKQDPDEDVAHDEAARRGKTDASSEAPSRLRPRQFPHRYGFWLRRYIQSLLSAPEYELPSALILMEDLQTRQARLSEGGFERSAELRLALQQAAGPAFVSEVLANLIRVDHSHVMRHFREEEKDHNSAPGTTPPKVTFTKEESEEETVSIVTLDHGSRQTPNTSPAPSKTRTSVSVQAALHSTEHTALIIKMLSSAILAEVKFTTASYLDVLSAGVAAISPDGNGDVDEATIVDSDKFEAALEATLARIRKEEGESSNMKSIDDLVRVRSAWARNLLFSREVGGKIRLLAAKMLMMEGAMENEWEAQLANARAAGEKLRSESDLPWAHEIREELLSIVMAETRRQLDERRARIKQPWPSHLLDLLPTTRQTFPALHEVGR